MKPPVRNRLPETRPAINHKFKIGGSKGYLTVGLSSDGKPSELFLKMDHDGSNTIGGLMSCLCIQTSMLLQYGVPLDTIADKMMHQQFAPSGPTSNKDIPMASSVVDYVFRWLTQQFPNETPKPKS